MKDRVLSRVPIIVLLAIPSLCFAESRIDSVLNALDKSLTHRAEYEKIKTERIDKLRSLLNETSDVTIKYKTVCSLYEEYKAYRFDSAFALSAHSLELARQIGDPVAVAEAQTNMAFCSVLGGISIEAKNTLDSVNSNVLPKDIRENYYFTCYKLWREEANMYSDTPFYKSYFDKSTVYVDSLLALTNPSTPQWWDYKGTLYMSHYDYPNAIKAFKRYLSFKSPTAHQRAMVYAATAWAYHWAGNEDEAIINFALSAINDNESATREITALYFLAKFISQRGYGDRASRYIHMALDDITFYNAHQRKVELSGILPAIEQERYEVIRSQRNTMIVALILAVLLVAAILVTYLLLRKKNLLLMKAEETERENMKALEEANTKLVEANNIKTEYVGLSFYANAEAIAKIEKLCKSIERQVTTKQYDKIKETVNPRRLEEERNNMYSAFDKSFLGLFPNFVEEYNNMFAEEDRRYPEQENALTSEMRIFALIRLGITDSERISKFLDYSVHTVNTYKTRIKNRSIVENDKFENRILQI